MGGFLFSLRREGETIEEHEHRIDPGLRVMARRGLRPGPVVRHPNFLLHLWRKSLVDTENLIQFRSDDFIAATGTLFHRGKSGAEALRNLFDAASGDGDWTGDLQGNYTVLLHKHGRLAVANDRSGFSHVYCNLDRSLLSSSFLAIASLLPRKTPGTQEFYEYIWQGATYGDKTLFEEVERLNSDSLHCIWPTISSESRPALSGLDAPILPFEEQASRVASELRAYFSMLKDNYGHGICTALTGGFDSRLMLAALRSVGVSPYIYVYGSRSSPDVAVASRVCAGEGLTLHHTDKNAFEKPPPEEYPGILLDRYFFNDGQGIEGVFDNGSDLATRRERASRCPLHLNGGGGEIYRNFFKLPDRRFTVQEFVDLRYSPDDARVCTDRFDPRAHRDAFAAKIQRSIGVRNDVLTRQDVERVYPAHRLRYWMGQNNSNGNVLSYAITPLAEPAFAWPSRKLPIPWKDLGRFQAALIRSIDPKLAAYASDYGFDFSGPIPWRIRSSSRILMAIPPRWIKALSRWKAKRRRPGSLPYYLLPPYSTALLPDRDLAVSEYIKVDEIRNPAVLNRVLTVELTLREAYSRPGP